MGCYMQHTLLNTHDVTRINVYHAMYVSRRVHTILANKITAFLLENRDARTKANEDCRAILLRLNYREASRENANAQTVSKIIFFHE